MTVRRSALPIWPLLALLALSGCDSKVRARAKKLERRGGAPPVVVADKEVRGSTELIDEIEPNDEANAAMKLSAPMGVKGTFASRTDVDLYRISVPADGTLSVVVDGVDGVDVIVDVVAGDKVLFSSDRGPADSAEGFPNLPVTEGQIVLLRVREFLKKKKRRRKKKKKEAADVGGPSPPYELRLALDSRVSANMEVEPNAGSDGAKELLLGDKGRGYLGWNKDVDSWRVSLLGFAAGSTLDVDLLGVPGVTLTLDVVDDKGKVVTSRTGKKGGDVFIRNLEPGKGPAHYGLRIKGRRSHPLEGYTIVASSRQLEPGDEVEPNDDVERATQAAEAGAASGQARGFALVGDKDYWRLPAPSQLAVLNLSLEVAPSSNLALAVVQGSMRAKADAGSTGATEQLVGVPVEPGRPIIVVVSGDAPANAAAPYTLTWEIAAGQDDEANGELE